MLPRRLHAHCFLCPQTIHVGRAPTDPLGPKLERLKIDAGLNLEEWNLFLRRWDAFVIGSGLNLDSCSTQLFQCTSEALENSLLRADPHVVNTSQLSQSYEESGSYSCGNWCCQDWCCQGCCTSSWETQKLATIKN